MLTPKEAAAKRAHLRREIAYARKKANQYARAAGRSHAPEPVDDPGAAELLEQAAYFRGYAAGVEAVLKELQT